MLQNKLTGCYLNTLVASFHVFYKVFKAMLPKLPKSYREIRNMQDNLFGRGDEEKLADLHKEQAQAVSRRCSSLHPSLHRHPCQK